MGFGQLRHPQFPFKGVKVPADINTIVLEAVFKYPYSVSGGDKG